MINASTIIAICWLIFLFYWGVNWWKVKPSKEIAWRSPSFGGTLFWIAVLIFLISRFVFHSHGFQVFTTTANQITITQIIGIIFTISGLIIAIVARKILADNWSSNIELKENHKLITTGIYKYVRHPIYTGIVFMGIGTIFVMQTISVIIFFIVMVVFFIFKFKKEEALLLKHFPKEYLAYMKKTKALIPFIY